MPSRKRRDGGWSRTRPSETAVAGFCSETGEPIAMCARRPISKTTVTRLDGVFRESGTDEWTEQMSTPAPLAFMNSTPMPGWTCHGTPLLPVPYNSR